MFLVYAAYSNSQLYEYNRKYECMFGSWIYGNVILYFLWSNVIMFLFMMKLSFIVVINLKHFYNKSLKKSKSGFQLFMLLQPKDAMWKFETENIGFHSATFLLKKTHFYIN